MNSPRIYDAIEPLDETAWFPSNSETGDLVACLESCKSILACRVTLNEVNPWSQLRALSLIATPLVSLLDHSISLHRAIGKADQTNWPAHDRENLTMLGKSIRKHSQGKLRLFRNKRTGHPDKKSFGDRKVPIITPDLILPPLGESLAALLLLMNFNRVFWWTRYPDPSNPRFVVLYGEVATTVELDEKMQPVSIVKISIVDDPRKAVFATVEKTIDFYNFLARTSTPKYPILGFSQQAS